MSGDSVKAYVYLLAESWLQEPRASLPNDDNVLASMARLPIDKWMTIKNEVLQHYFLGECEEHKDRFCQNTLLEISRNSQSKQRFKNKNAKRTQIKRKVNADAEYETEYEIGIKQGSVSWLSDFNIYKSLALEAIQSLLKDPAWIAERERYHPGLNIRLSLEKAWGDFWATEAGWKNKKAKKPKEIDWKRTANNSLSQKSSQVWKERQKPNADGIEHITMTEEEFNRRYPDYVK